MSSELGAATIGKHTDISVADVFLASANAAERYPPNLLRDATAIDLHNRQPCLDTCVHVHDVGVFVLLKDNSDGGWVLALKTEWLEAQERISRQTSDFSSGRKQYFVKGHLNNIALEAFPDSGADQCLISLSMASRLGVKVVPGTARTIHLANKKPVQSPGMIRVPWIFSGESTMHWLKCWVLPGCVHSLVLGNEFLKATKTLTRFASRIKSKPVGLPRRLRLRLLGEEKQRLWGFLNGHLTAALPDTGSDVMLISNDYAQKIGVTIDRDCENWLEVEFADGSTAWTSGVARNVPWTVGGKTIRCDFHVLDDLCVDVVLSNDYLFETSAFSEHSDWLFDTNSEEDLFQLCNIRLIGRFSDNLMGLEDEYLEDG